MIKKIGQFTYYFADMDTVILDKNSAVMWEYGQNQLSEAVTAIYQSVEDNLKQDQEE